ncbi:uncharacterized protein LOC113854628 [Abrus precatorius]|uniref:Uncharacterized protein LOC113854628 n=1 Tax=Abrus precatorius TaxID=3816 RepID=A0A8B8KCP7_ABRPR|nr:uncharacterized protein LOC113854628 [Abrus precatorius]
MLHSQCHHHLLLPFSHHKPFLSIPPSSHPLLSFHHKPTFHHSVSVSAIPLWLAELTTATETEGPIELPLSSTPSIFATTDEPSPIQIASSVLLTGAISVFLFRSLRRRAKRAKELQLRSSGEKKSVQEEALDSLKAIGSASIDAKGPPSAGEALFGGISAGIIALILYKFATTIEASLNQQTLSDNYSVRQITITIRTIVNGLAYLVTFVFGLNSLGLLLYSGQLAIKSIMGDSTEKETESKSSDQSNLTNSIDSPTDNTELSNRKEEQISNDAQ